jgi:ketosteroid isomerase-like protein
VAWQTKDPVRPRGQGQSSAAVILVALVADSVLDLARRGFDAYNAGDIEAVLELVADDMVAVVPSELPNEGVYRGPEGFRKMMVSWREAWDEFRIEPIELIQQDDFVIVPLRQFGRGRGSGIEVEMELTQLMQVRDGRLVQWRLFRQTADALAHARAGDSAARA